VPSAVDEILRYRPPAIGTGRTAREDFAYRGSDPRGVEWTMPFGIHAPSWLPLRWDVV
jgi:hypothetical protein